MQESSHILQEQVKQAAVEKQALAICGGNSKRFYGRAMDAITLTTGIHTGITEYSPAELVITARAGTPLMEIEQTLATHGQMLACEAPHFSAQATFGGMIAAGLSGPSRPYRAAVQDTVLGCTIVNGKGEILRFGGKVMKNVAGYDVSRLMTGSLGCLGLILDATVKVVPKPPAELTINVEIQRKQSTAFINELRRQGLPVSASSHDGNSLRLRFSAGQQEVDSLGGLFDRHYGYFAWQVDSTPDYWTHLREHTLAFFDTDQTVWRLSASADAAMNTLMGVLDELDEKDEKDEKDSDMLTEWGGALHWLKTNHEPDTIFAHMAACQGHATRFQKNAAPALNQVFQPLSTVHQDWHVRLKQAFDPSGIFNPGRMYAGI